MGEPGSTGEEASAPPTTTQQKHKTGRHRKKALYAQILKQMEFYFSDSNLTKDRFLSQLTQKDPFVELSVFLSFNKIRKFNVGIEDLRKALGKSELLELSEDKLKVRRKQPLVPKDNVDECTVYVERLKPDVTHEWLSTAFSEFGEVVYVSIPKYKQNGAIKGFAFIEYKQESGAQAALDYFDSIGCKIPSATEPDKLCSIATFCSDGSGNKSSKKRLRVGKEECENNEDDDEETVEKVLKKQKVDEKIKPVDTARVKIEEESLHEDETTTYKHISKKVKIDGDISATVDVSSSKNEDHGKSKKRKIKEETIEEVVETIPMIEKTSEKVTEKTTGKKAVENEGKSKKRNKKSLKVRANLKEIGIQVLSKIEWKKMRNRYLNAQRNSMKELKQHLLRQKFSNGRHLERNQRHHHQYQSQEAATPEKTEGFTPGLIVHVDLRAPCEDNRQLKSALKELAPDIQYVDLPLPVGCEEVILRFASAEGAKIFCEADAFEGASACRLLDGKDEASYWEKIAEQREAKRRKDDKKEHNRRGRDKLLKRAEKRAAQHIRFGHDDEDEHEEVAVGGKNVVAKDGET